MGFFRFTVGCPGAGKSTYADSLTYHGWQKLCMDDFRVALFGSKQNFWRTVERGGVEGGVARTMVRTAYGAVFGELVKLDINLVIANTHTVHGMPEFLTARKLGHQVGIVVLDPTLDELLKRNATRPEDDRVSEDFIRSEYEAFKTRPGWWQQYSEAIEWRRP
jgi:predicted kinase